MSNETRAGKALETYLNDHLGGSVTGLQLVDHLIDIAEGPSDADFFKGIRAEISEDRAALEAVIQRVGGTTSGVRQVGGWIAEKLSRLKLVVEDPRDKLLRRMETLELLALGIQGKRLMWRALAAASLRALQEFDLDHLERRAGEQYEKVEAKRIEAALRALASLAE